MHHRVCMFGKKTKTLIKKSLEYQTPSSSNNPFITQIQQTRVAKTFSPVGGANFYQASDDFLAKLMPLT